MSPIKHYINASFILSIVNETPALNAEGTSDVFKRLKIFNIGETNNIHSGEKETFLFKK